MTKTRAALLLVGIAASALIVCGRGNAAFVQRQRDQIAVNILVNVTPDPLAYRMALRGRGSDGIVALASVQSAVRVQAQVSPNPNATLLYSNTPAVVISQTAGTTASTPACVYTVTVDTPAKTSWTLDDGLSGDFITTTWPGGDLANNTYAGTPMPAATPFVVYAKNNNTWNPKEKSSGLQTYCVTLTLTIPASIPAGGYTTNAVYTLYY